MSEVSICGLVVSIFIQKTRAGGHIEVMALAKQNPARQRRRRWQWPTQMRRSTTFSTTTSQSTRSVYFRAIARFVAWMWPRPDCQHLFTDEFCAAARPTDCSEAFVRTWLQRTPFAPPARLAALHHRDFCRFLVAQRKADGSQYSKSVMDTFWSGLVYLFTVSGEQMEVEFAARLCSTKTSSTR